VLPDNRQGHTSLSPLHKKEPQKEVVGNRKNVRENHPHGLSPPCLAFAVFMELYLTHPNQPAPTLSTFPQHTQQHSRMQSLSILKSAGNLHLKPKKGPPLHP
jgi:hypothetical protein